ADEIVAMMKNFRANPPKSLGGGRVVVVKDYADLNKTDMTTGKIEKMDMPVTSNVLQYFTEDGTKISIRPSGTEPKIKFYIEVRGHMGSPADYEKAIKEADAKIDEVKKDLGI
ncbi:MAG: phospho-sugar mutase, partial [Muribaculaceae bacterium]|nr:phospho-sugar mutase [Muribaculaceae bacterium]